MKSKDHNNKNKFRQKLYKDISKKWVFLNSFLTVYVMTLTIIFIAVPISNKLILGSLLTAYSMALTQLIREAEQIWNVVGLLFKRIFKIGRNTKNKKKGGKNES